MSIKNVISQSQIKPRIQIARESTYYHIVCELRHRLVTYGQNPKSMHLVQKGFLAVYWLYCPVLRILSFCYHIWEPSVSCQILGKKITHIVQTGQKCYSGHIHFGHILTGFKFISGMS